MVKDQVKTLSLFAITWPIFIESALHMTLRIADTFMVSRISDDAVAAVGVANQLIMFAFFMFNFVAIGAGVVVSQYLGAQKKNEISKIVGASLGINLIFGLIISLLMVTFSRPLLLLFGLEAHLLDISKTYLLIVGGALFLQAIMITISSIVQSHGFTRDTMFVAVGMNILNIVLNYLFIFGALGFPQLGVTGVAIATVISQLVGLTANMLVLTRKVNVQLTWNRLTRWSKEHVMSILKIGVPTSITQLSYSGNQIVITVFIVSLGADMLTTRIYTQNIMFIIMILAISLGRAMQITIGHIVGSGDFEAAYKRVFRNLAISMGLTLTAVTIIALFRKPLIGLFTNDPQIIALGATLLLMGFLLEPGRNFNILIERSLQAAGDARFAMISSVIIIWSFSLPLAYFLGIHLAYGLIGIWTAFIIDEWIRGMILLYRWRSRAWQKKAIVKKAPDPPSQPEKSESPKAFVEV